MATLEELLSEDASPAPAAKTSLDNLLSEAPMAVISKPKEAPSEKNESPSWWQRAATMGAADPIVGLGQTAQNVLPDSFLNTARTAFASVVGTIPGVSEKTVREFAAPVSTDEFNAQVRKHEGQYQGERADAGREGMDWWRVSGALANPMTWLSPSGEATTLVQGIKAGAKAGAFQALLQPVTSEGNFLWDKSMQATLGAAAGGTLGGALKLLEPAFRFGTNAIRRMMGTNADDRAIDLAADQITRNVTKTATGDTPINPDVYSSIKREVADSLKAGVEPSAEIITRRADAAALPVPVEMTRAQLTRDPMAWAWEHRVSGQRGVGEPLSDLLAGQNRALVENINALGAKAAPSPYAASEQVISHLKSVDDAMRAEVNEAYSAVRNSAGRPAAMDVQGFAEAAKNGLTEGRPELASVVNLGDFLAKDAPEVAKQFNDITSGKVPLTVDTAQWFDRTWGEIQRGNVSNAAKKAIGALRNALNDAPVSDSLGQDAMKAYKTARGLARQRFDLIDSNPALKAVVDEAAEPDKFFQKYIEGANVSELKGLKNILGGDLTSMLQNTFVGQLKRSALNKASDEAGTFSQAAYNRVMQDPVRMPRIQELFASNPKTLDQLYRLGRVSENLIKPPAAARVNTSNTAAEASNIVRDVARSEAGEALSSMLPNWMTGIARMTSRAGKEVEMARQVQQAVSPGVTAAPLPRPQQPTMSSLSGLLTRGAGAAVAGEQRENKRD